MTAAVLTFRPPSARRRRIGALVVLAGLTVALVFVAAQFATARHEMRVFRGTDMTLFFTTTSTTFFN